MSVEAKIDKIRSETVALRKEIVIMKTLVKQQSGFIKALLQNSHGPGAVLKYNIKPKDWFPIRTQEELDRFEKAVNPANRKEIIYEAQICMRPGGLSDSLHKILDEDLVVNFNIEGNFNKARLLDYENLIDVLFRATREDGWDKEKFMNELRHGMRKIKKRMLKRSRKRSLAEWNDMQKKQMKSDNTEDDNGDNNEDDKEAIEFEKKTQDWFPIRTQKELDMFEKGVNVSNREKIIEEAQFCIREGGLCETVNKIFDEKLIVQYNLEGKYNKGRLFDYDNVMDILFRATQADGWDHETFIAEFRKGIRKIKKKKYKIESRKRCKARWMGKFGSEDDDYE